MIGKMLTHFTGLELLIPVVVALDQGVGGRVERIEVSSTPNVAMGLNHGGLSAIVGRGFTEKLAIVLAW